jgi:haloalkane dehalogenase
MAASLDSRFVTVDGLRLHYLEGGNGDPVLLLHGWPTSSFLWRNVAPPIAAGRRVLALDLPGFGKSDKPLDASYSFRFYAEVLDGFLAAVGVDRLSLVVHDLGGPIGLYWACQHPERIQRLALLNTIVYANPSWAVILFVMATRLPLLRSYLASPAGLRLAMWIGISDASRLTDEVVRGVQEPFDTPEACQALLKAGHGLHPAGFKEIERVLPSFTIPVRAIYGEHDWILPDVAATMKRVATDLPQTQITALPCGHFLQEERPEEIGKLLAGFLGGSGR